MPFKFPYTNFQELNLDWIIKKVKDLSKQIEDDSSIVSEYIDRLLAVEDKADNAEATATAADARATGANTTANSALTLATQAKQTAEIADLSTTLLGLKIGDLSSLYTTAKDTIVNAINEVWSIFHNATAVTNVTPAGTDPAVTYSNGVFTFDLPEGGDPDAVTHAELDAAIDDVEDTIDALTDRVDGLEDSIDDLSEELDNKADVIIDTASGDIVDFPDGAATPFKSLVVNVEPVQAGTGDPSPSNVRPISGWNGVTVHRDGKNFIDDSVFYYSGVSRRTSGTGINTLRLFINSLPPGTYTIAFDAVVDVVGDPTTNWEFGFYGTSTYGTINSIINKVNPAVGSVYRPSVTITKPAGGVINTLYLYAASSSVDDRATISKFQLELNSTATAYEPHTGNSYPVSWSDEAGTVHSGILTINEDGSGIIKVKTLMITDNGTSDRWTFTISSGKNYIYMSTPQEAKTTQTIICNLYKGVSNSSYINLNNFELSMTTTPFNYVNIRDDSINSIEDFKSLIQNTPIQLLFTLTNPVIYQLTQTQVINALKGYNAVWSDAGSVDVTYRADTKGYIDKLIAQVQALALGG